MFQHTKVALRIGLLAMLFLAMDKGGKSALVFSRERRLQDATAWGMHHHIQRAMADRNPKVQLAGLVKRDDTSVGRKSQSPGRRPRMAQGNKDREPTKIRWWWGFWWSDGAAVDAAGAKAHPADHRVTLSRDLNASSHQFGLIVV